MDNAPLSLSVALKSGRLEESIVLSPDALEANFGRPLPQGCDPRERGLAEVHGTAELGEAARVIDAHGDAASGGQRGRPPVLADVLRADHGRGQIAAGEGFPGSGAAWRGDAAFLAVP